MVSQTLPYLINTDEADLGGKVCFVFFGPSVLMCIYLYFCFPEMKGRNYAELEEMFQKRVPARKFKDYVVSDAPDLIRTMEQKSTMKQDETEVEMKEVIS